MHRIGTTLITFVLFYSSFIFFSSFSSLFLCLIIIIIRRIREKTAKSCVFSVYQCVCVCADSVGCRHSSHTCFCLHDVKKNCRSRSALTTMMKRIITLTDRSYGSGWFLPVVTYVMNNRKTFT